MAITQLENQDVLQWSSTSGEWRATTVLTGVSVPDIGASFEAGEAITAGDAVVLVPKSTEDQSYAEANQDADLALGDDAARTYLAQGFKPSSTAFCTQVDLYMKNSGSPSGDITVEIWSNSGTTPSAVVNSGLSATLTGSDIGANYAWHSVLFPELVELTSGTQYYIVLKRTVAVNASNYFIWGVDNSSASYGSTNDRRLVGDATPTWTETTTSDCIFKTYVHSTTASVVRKAKATSNLLTRNFIGFAKTAISSGSTGTITRLGEGTNFSGITPGRLHYLSDTAGSVGTAPGTKSAPVMVAEDTTTGQIISLQPPVETIYRYAGQNTQYSFNDTLGSGGENTIFSTTIPGGTMGANGILEVEYTGVMTVGVLNFRVSLGGTDIGNFAPDTNGDYFYSRLRLINRNSQTSQVTEEFQTEGPSGVQELDLFINTYTVNTANDTALRVYAVNGGASGNRQFQVEYILVRVIR